MNAIFNEISSRLFLRKEEFLKQHETDSVTEAVLKQKGEVNHTMNKSQFLNESELTKDLSTDLENEALEIYEKLLTED